MDAAHARLAEDDHEVEKIQLVMILLYVLELHTKYICILLSSVVTRATS